MQRIFYKQSLEELEAFLDYLNICGFPSRYEETTNDLIKVFIKEDESSEEKKYLFCMGFNAILNYDRSIWVSKEEKDFLEKNIDYFILFNISIRWYESKATIFKEGKEKGFQVPVDFKQIKFFKKSLEKENFVHLHNHFEFSQLDGCLQSEKWLEQCQKIGAHSLALTDHGTLSGILDFYMQAKKKEIKPILGCEFYIVEEKFLNERMYDHLTILAKNNNGWNNLLKLNSFAQLKGFYYKPRLTYEYLKEYLENKKDVGLFLLTGCPLGKMSKLLLQGNLEEAKNLYLFFCDIFKEENVFLEIQIHNYNDKEQTQQQDILHINLIKLFNLLKKKNYNPKFVLTNDCHYPDENDLKVWKMINRISAEKDDENFSIDLFLKTRKQLLQDFKKTKIYNENYVNIKDFKEWCNNTILISKNCNVEIPIGQHNLPEFPLPKTVSNKEYYFNSIIAEGFKNKIENNLKSNYRGKDFFEELKKYKGRLETEKQVIIKAGFIDYFLIIWDIIKQAKENNIFVGAARGSVAGSLVAYVMDITDIEPIKFNLLFERFLNETRVSGERSKESDALPDIDMDFESNGREWVKKYVEKKYGQKNVCSLATYGRLQLRSAIKDLSKIINLDFESTNQITKSIFGNKWEDLAEAISKNNNVRKFVYDHPDIMAIIDRCIGQVRHSSIHPAGMIISPSNKILKSGKKKKTHLDDFIPVKYMTNEAKEKELVSEWEGSFVERRGLLKIDVLGIRQLDIFKMILKMVKKNYGLDINLNEINLDDKNVYEKFCSGDTEGVFQFKSRIQKEYQKKLQPDNIEHLIAANALLRPGAMISNAHNDFVDIKNGRKRPQFDFGLEEVTKETFGLYVYQEQIMKAMVVGGGLSLAEADVVRTAIKKFDKEKMSKFKEKFIEGIKKIHKYKQKDALKVWEKLMAFSGYGFNRSHSCSYAILGYQCQWLKVKYPKEFWLANLQFADEDDRKEYVKRIITSYKSFVEISFPSINKSKTNFYLDGKEIVWSLTHIKGVGEKASLAILKARAEKSFDSLKDFFERVEKRVVNKRVVVNLILSGCFDEFYSIDFDKEKIKRKEIIKEYFILRKEKNIEGLMKEYDLLNEAFFEHEYKKLLSIDLISWEDLLNNAKILQQYKNDYVEVKELENVVENANVLVCGEIKRAYEKDSSYYEGKFGRILIDQDGFECYLHLYNKEWKIYRENILSNKIKFVAFYGRKTFESFINKNVIKSIKTTILKKI